MQNASPNHGGTKHTEDSQSLLRALRVSVAHHRVAFCILNFAFLVPACAKTAQPVITPPPIDATRQLQIDLTAVTQLPGVQRATWGIAIPLLRAVSANGPS